MIGELRSSLGGDKAWTKSSPEDLSMQAPPEACIEHGIALKVLRESRSSWALVHRVLDMWERKDKRGAIVRNLRFGGGWGRVEEKEKNWVFLDYG